MLTEKPKEEMINRLKRIEGQVAGIRRMVESETYCVEVLHQFGAVQGALSRAAQAVLSAHIDSCVSTSLEKGDLEDRKAKLTELVELFDRYGRVIGR